MIYLALWIVAACIVIGAAAVVVSLLYMALAVVGELINASLDRLGSGLARLAVRISRRFKDNNTS